MINSPASAWVDIWRRRIYYKSGKLSGRIKRKKVIQFVLWMAILCFTCKSAHNAWASQDCRKPILHKILIQGHLCASKLHHYGGGSNLLVKQKTSSNFDEMWQLHGKPGKVFEIWVSQVVHGWYQFAQEDRRLLGEFLFTLEHCIAKGPSRNVNVFHIWGLVS